MAWRPCDRPDADALSGLAAWAPAVGAVRSARWMRDGAGHYAVVVSLDELLRLAGTDGTGTAVETTRDLVGPVLVVPQGTPSSAIGAAIAELRSRPTGLMMIALGDSAPDGLPDDATAAATLTVADATLVLYRLGPAAADSLKQAREQLEPAEEMREIEDPRHLEGRARWFKSRHPGKT